MKKDELKNYLFYNCQGRKKAISGSRLHEVLGVSENEMRRLVNRLRREGVPIASDKTGYFYARTAGETYSTIRGLKKMRSGLDAAISGLESALDDFETEPTR